MNKYLEKISSDLSIATQSKKEEDKAIGDYTDRLKEAKSPDLKSAIEHARKEEGDHSKSFGKVLEKLAARKKRINKIVDAVGDASTVYNAVKNSRKKKVKA